MMGLSLANFQCLPSACGSPTSFLNSSFPNSFTSVVTVEAVMEESLLVELPVLLQAVSTSRQVNAGKMYLLIYVVLLV